MRGSTLLLLLTVFFSAEAQQQDYGKIKWLAGKWKGYGSYWGSQAGQPPTNIPSAFELEYKPDSLTLIVTYQGSRIVRRFAGDITDEYTSVTREGLQTVVGEDIRTLWKFLEIKKGPNDVITLSIHYTRQKPSFVAIAFLEKQKSSPAKR